MADNYFYIFIIKLQLDFVIVIIIGDYFSEYIVGMNLMDQHNRRCHTAMWSI